MKNNNFKEQVIRALATHTTKLDTIQSRLKSIDRTLSHSLNRVNSLEAGFAYVKGLGIFVGSALTIFIALVAYLK
ncbi:hypothetical protein CMI37_18630 [Candidatus Pacearchaeota archaeon]|nr:hypothetical protein [Candidatus Pacearchaeota archaeon]